MQGDGKYETDKRNKTRNSIEWAFADIVRPIFGKQQGAISNNGQGIFRRGVFGITYDKHLILLVSAEYGECHTKSSRAWIQRGMQSST